MVRVKSSGPQKKKAHKKVLENAKGYYSASSRCYRVAKQATVRAGQYSYVHRRKRGNEFRSLWIQRINAFLRARSLKYSDFINRFNKLVTLKKMPFISRKTLSDLMINEVAVADVIVQKVFSDR